MFVCLFFYNETVLLTLVIVGADDGDVDIYGSNLHTMARNITDPETLDFMSLPDIFSSKMHKFDNKYVEGLNLPHYLDTQIESEAEMCRKIMMNACQTDDSILRGLIDKQDPIKLALYRGFRKFMEEDLAMNPIVSSVSRKAKKNLCGKVAFEMIKVSYLNTIYVAFY